VIMEFAWRRLGVGEHLRDGAVRASRVRRPLGSPGSVFWQMAGPMPLPAFMSRVSHKALLVLLQLAVAQAGRPGALRAWAWGPAAHSIISKPTGLSNAGNVGGKATQAAAKRLHCVRVALDDLVIS
jgi:hypothetical protein